VDRHALCVNYADICMLCELPVRADVRLDARRDLAETVESRGIVLCRNWPAKTRARAEVPGESGLRFAFAGRDVRPTVCDLAGPSATGAVLGPACRHCECEGPRTSLFFLNRTASGHVRSLMQRRAIKKGHEASLGHGDRCLAPVACEAERAYTHAQTSAYALRRTLLDKCQV